MPTKHVDPGENDMVNSNTSSSYIITKKKNRGRKKKKIECACSVCPNDVCMDADQKKNEKKKTMQVDRFTPPHCFMAS